MPLVFFIFLVGVIVSLIIAASLAFTIYEVRRTNPHAFGLQSPVKPPPDL